MRDDDDVFWITLGLTALALAAWIVIAVVLFT